MAIMTNEQFYEASNLTMNPFRTTPVVEADPRMGIWVGYDKEREVLLKYLTRTRADQVGNNNFILLYGDYGIGKSHALLWSRHLILNTEKETFESVAFYIPTLKKAKGQISFAGAFVQDIVANSNLVRDLQQFKQFFQECIVDYKRINKLGHDFSHAAASERLLKSSELHNFASRILECDTPKDLESLLTPASDYDAMLIFTRIVNLFVFEFELDSKKKRFKKGAYLFMDELDLLARATSKEAREVNDLLRHLFDSCPNCFCMVLGFTATAAELSVIYEKYVLDRVTWHIVLDYLQPDEARQFVQAILDNARLDKTKKNKAGFFPFSEQAVEAIVSQIVSITPRRIISDMQKILEECRLAGFDPKKGPVTPKMLEDSGIQAEIQGRS